MELRVSDARTTLVLALFVVHDNACLIVVIVIRPQNTRKKGIVRNIADKICRQADLTTTANFQPAHRVYFELETRGGAFTRQYWNLRQEYLIACWYFLHDVDYANSAV